MDSLGDRSLQIQFHGISADLFDVLDDAGLTFSNCCRNSVCGRLKSSLLRLASERLKEELRAAMEEKKAENQKSDDAASADTGSEWSDDSWDSDVTHLDGHTPVRPTKKSRRATPAVKPPPTVGAHETAREAPKPDERQGEPAWLDRVRQQKYWTAPWQDSEDSEALWAQLLPGSPPKQERC